jgi:hypothetical protein
MDLFKTPPKAGNCGNLHLFIQIVALKVLAIAIESKKRNSPTPGS